MLGWFRWRAIALALLMFAGVLPAFAQVALRVATWNVLAVGAPGTAEYNAALAILRRLDADVVAINEVSGSTDTNNFERLRQDLGYAHSVVGAPSPFGPPLVAFLSHYRLSSSTTWASPALSGESAANDITRNILEIQVDEAQLGGPLSLFTTHWKSGTANSDEFRRAIESTRMGSLARQRIAEGVPVILMGDVNADVLDPAGFPTTFTTPPAGLPTSFNVGADIEAIMASGGLANNAFAPLVPHAAIVEARQRDGSDATRPASGRRIDYLFADRAIQISASEVFDCADEALPSAMVFFGAPVAATDCATASDHLPVVADVVVPTRAPSAFTLTVSRTGGGTGSVQSQPAGIDCGTDCAQDYPAGQSVTLSAAAASGSAFSAWGGACAGVTVNVCTVTMNAAQSVTAEFVPSLPVAEFSVSAVSVLEGAASVTLTVRRSSGVGVSSVSFTTRNGTATAGSDYTARSGSVSFAAGTTTATVSVSLLNDSLWEPPETFFVDLTGVSGAALGTNRTATVTITDDDRNVEFSSPAASVSEAAGTVTLWVNRLGDAASTATVRFATANGSARSGSDYVAASGTLSWAAGDTASKPVTIRLVNDTSREKNETFLVTLSSPTGATLGRNTQATVTITNDD